MHVGTKPAASWSQAGPCLMLTSSHLCRVALSVVSSASQRDRQQTYLHSSSAPRKPLCPFCDSSLQQPKTNSEDRRQFNQPLTTTTMDFIFQDFSTAFAENNGYQLGQTLSPELPPETLKIIWKSTNHHQARDYIRRNLKRGADISKQELDGWTDVFHQYWLCVGAVLAVQQEVVAPGNVGPFLASWIMIIRANSTDTHTSAANLGQSL